MTDPNEDLLNFEIRISMQGYLTPADVREDLRLLADCMSTHKALADKIGVSEAYLCNVIAGNRPPGPKVLKFLHIKKMIVYHEMTLDERRAK